MSGGATSAREAALKVILEDVYPLITQIEEAALLLKTVREELRGDLEELGSLAKSTNDGLGDVVAVSRRVRESLAAFETAKPSKAPSPPPSIQKTGMVAVLVIGASLVSALIAASCVGGALYMMGGRELVEQARLGQSLQKAWPALDESTRKRVEQAMN